MKSVRKPFVRLYLEPYTKYEKSYIQSFGLWIQIFGYWSLCLEPRGGRRRMEGENRWRYALALEPDREAT
jgi:hypothetical protein